MIDGFVFKACNISILTHKPPSPEQAKEYAEKMLGNRLITKQTGAQGRICNAVSLSSHICHLSSATL